jgi:hypothetical protein
MKKNVLSVILFAAVLKVNAQGCSDAGVCTIHSIKDNTAKSNAEDKSKNEVLLGFSFGKGERSVSYYTPYVEYTRNLTSRTSVSGKLSLAAISGELARTSGLGDFFLSVNHVFDNKSKWQKSFVAGLKIPFDQADISKKGIHLPMPYQTSLGTTDLVLGLNLMRKSFGATLAVQQPLKPTNRNGFLPGDYPSTPLALKYWPTNKFVRKGDVLLRLSYNFNSDKKFSIRPSILGIYHEANDTYEDGNKLRRPIYNSKGLTLNGIIFFDYKLKKGNALELSIGAPFVVRDQRPDGLTRHFVTALEYRFSF